MEQPSAERFEHMDYHYRAPRGLRRTPFAPKKVLVVGSCLSYDLAIQINETRFNTAEARGLATVRAVARDTDANLLSHDLFERADFRPPANGSAL